MPGGTPQGVDRRKKTNIRLNVMGFPLPRFFNYRYHCGPETTPGKEKMVPQVWNEISPFYFFGNRYKVDPPFHAFPAVKNQDSGHDASHCWHAAALCSNHCPILLNGFTTNGSGVQALRCFRLRCEKCQEKNCKARATNMPHAPGIPTEKIVGNGKQKTPRQKSTFSASIFQWWSAIDKS